MNRNKSEYSQSKNNRIQLLWTDEVKTMCDDMAASDFLSRNEFVIRLIIQEMQRRPK